MTAARAGHALGGLEGRKVRDATRYLGGIYCLTFDDGSTVTFSNATFTHATFTHATIGPCWCAQADCPECSSDTGDVFGAVVQRPCATCAGKGEATFGASRLACPACRGAGYT